MSKQAIKEMSSGDYDREAPRYPLRKWVFSQDVGLPPFLETGDSRWIKRGLAAWSWPGCIPAPLFVPYISELMPHSSQKISKWRVNMDVSHFSPSEIFISVRNGFLEVGGKHEERPDEHGFISRCFTRKYRLPAEVDVTTLMSSLSVDGLLTVEAPLPETSATAAIIIPIKVETEGIGEPETKQEDQGEESLLEACSDQVQPSNTTAGPEQGDEETSEKPAGQSHSLLPVEDKSLESVQKSSEQCKVPESQEGLSTSNLLEHKEPVVDGEIQVKAKGAEELSLPEEQELGSGPPIDVQSQELEAANIEQEHTE
ncbi:heat shock protein beta-1 [Girardinichthys multiradiatus]|uniref:heat shock protein beta-1 n=1 Tax=Girardinichthys multiradiatus TaxID=208333 RepID=UPI001FADC643|nr:heat shock protein beta-1 [Girardinichthys multiradiatus]